MSDLRIVPGIFPDDNPRTRTTDPIGSHMAADVSAFTLTEIKKAVLVILYMFGPLTGSQINEIYGKRQIQQEWPDCHFDSPRKRAGELYAEGQIQVVGREGRQRVFAAIPPEQEDAA